MDSKEEEHPKMQIRNKISTSYGLVVYTVYKSQPMFLLTRRRDTFSYECILRGMYTPELLLEYVSNTTADERRRLLQYDFDNLWKDLWVSTRRRLYRTEMKKAGECWKSNVDLIRKLVRECAEEGKDLWDFAKGRRFIEENIYQCALREFEEETGLSRNLIKIVDEAGSYEDNYQGTDHKMYRSIYFLGYISNGMALKFHYTNCPYQMRDPYISDEVMEMKWMDYKTALEMIIPSRKALLERVHRFLEHSYQE